MTFFARSNYENVTNLSPLRLSWNSQMNYLLSAMK